MNKDEKRKESNRQYRIKHNKELLEKNRMYRLKNKEKERLRHKKYKSVNKLKIKESNKKYRKEHHQERLHYNKKWKINNKEKIATKDKERSKKYYLKNKNRIKAQTKEYRKYHKRERQNNNKNRLKIDPLFKLNYMISRSVSKSLKNIDRKKQVGWKILLGYDNIELKQHLEKQFTPEMNWKNYGIYWHIDHIVPLSWFKTEEQLIKKGWRLKNLQPLEAKINIEKGNNFVGNSRSSKNIIYL